MELVALGITNLTDARYFSAMGVDWMGFDLRSDSSIGLSHVQAFSEWIEGPALIADVRGKDVDQIAEILSGFKADGLIVSEEIELPNYGGSVFRIAPDEGNCDRIIASHNESLPESLTGVPVWRHVSGVHDLASLQEGTAGVVIVGGEEEQTGVKDYDEIDQLFEALEAIRD